MDKKGDKKMKPILCETCLNGEKEIKEVTYGWHKRKMLSLYIFCKRKERYVHSAEKYKCSYYANITLENCQNVK